MSTTVRLPLRLLTFGSRPIVAYLWLSTALGLIRAPKRYVTPKMVLRGFHKPASSLGESPGDALRRPGSPGRVSAGPAVSVSRRRRGVGAITRGLSERIRIQSGKWRRHNQSRILARHGQIARSVGLPLFVEQMLAGCSERGSGDSGNMGRDQHLVASFCIQLARYPRT